MSDALGSDAMALLPPGEADRVWALIEQPARCLRAGYEGGGGSR